MLGMVSPSPDVLLRIEVGDRDPETVGSTHAFRSEEAGHQRDQFLHTLGGLGVSIVIGGALRRKDHRVIRRWGKSGKFGR